MNTLLHVLTVLFLSIWLETLCSASCPSNCLCDGNRISCDYLEKKYTSLLVNVTKDLALKTKSLTARARILHASYQRSLFVVRRAPKLIPGESYVELEDFIHLEKLTIITGGRFFIEEFGASAFSHLRELRSLVIREERPDNHYGYFDPTRIIKYPIFGNYPKLEHLNIQMPTLEYGPRTLKNQPFIKWPWGDNASFPRLRTLYITMNITEPNPCDNIFAPFLNISDLHLGQSFESNTNNWSLSCFRHLESLTMGNSNGLIDTLNSIPNTSLTSLGLSDVNLMEYSNQYGCAIRHKLRRLTASKVLPSAGLLLQCIRDRTNIDTLVLKDSNIKSLQLEYFQNFTSLKFLDLSDNIISLSSGEGKANERFALSHEYTPNLTFLDLSNNEIPAISDVIATDLIQLEIFNITQNILQEVDLNELIGLKSLRELTLSHNAIRYIFLRRPARFKVLSLRKLDLGYNILKDLPFLLSTTFPDLQWLNVEYNKISSLSSQLVSWKKLRYLNVKNNELTGLDPGFFNHLDYINLSENNIKDVSFLSYLSGEEDVRITLRDNPINCDCQTISTIHALRQFAFLQDTSLTCKNDSDLSNVDILRYETVIRKVGVACAAYRDCYRSCRCYKTKEGKMVKNVANCSDSQLTVFPVSLPLKTERLYINRNQIETFPSSTRFPDLREIHIADNNIKSIFNTSFIAFPNLQYLNLDRNGIAEVLEGTFEGFSNLSLVSLKGNNLHCDCSQKWIQKWIKERNITFISTCNGTSLTSFDFTEMCDKTKFILNVAVLVVVLIVVAALVAIVAIAFFYRTEVAVYVYNRYRQFSHDDTDKDKEYDIFVSYSSDDSAFVRKVIIQKMEIEWGYKLCIHERDFLPGEYIADNITYAVEKSRRTLTLLSDSYIQSEWCVFEFAVAHQQSLKDRCRRLVVVKLSDLSPELLAKENMVGIYLKTNTFLFSGCRMFWEKVLGTLPAKSLKHLKDQDDKT